MFVDKLHIVIMGGTIDSVWSGVQDTVVVSESSTLPEYFNELGRNLKFPFELVFSEICMKDSRALTDEDREKAIKAIEENEARKVIVTHGTYTMPDTARYFKENLKQSGKTIIFTGSMVPIKGFDFSDGPFNLGFAIAMINNLEPGVYVCMNAQAFTPEEVAKNIKEGKFYSIFKDEQ